MLFMTTFRPKPNITHAEQKESLALWDMFQPPSGFEFKSYYSAADGRGWAVVEADSIEAVYEAYAPWGEVYMNQEVIPVMDMGKAIELLKKAIATREAM